MKKNITRDDIAEYINDEFGLTKKDCNDLVNNIIDHIIEGLKEQKIVKIHNFGTFKLKHKNKRIGRNPRTKQNFIISERNVVAFTPSKSILSLLNKNIDE